jgi:hypothetical protein
MPKDLADMVTDSRYFTNEFNTAIIDGPLRIYFADRQEANALQIYFDIQETLQIGGMKLDDIPMTSPHMFLMLYPSEESFKVVFNNGEKTAFGKFGENLVLGINGPCADQTRKLICNQVKTVFTNGDKSRTAAVESQL